MQSCRPKRDGPGTSGPRPRCHCVPDAAALRGLPGGGGPRLCLARGRAAGARPVAQGRRSDVLRALRERPVLWANIADATGWPEERERALRVAGALVAEGLAVDEGDRLSLPL